MKRIGTAVVRPARVDKRAPSGPTVEIRIPTQEGTVLESELAKPGVNSCERSVLALVGLSRTPTDARVLIRKVIPIPDDAYFPTARGSAWSPLVTGSALSQGMRTRAGLLLAHRHSGSAFPQLSVCDRDSFRQLLPRCIDLLPDWPHASVVLGDHGSVGGQVWLPGTDEAEVREVLRVTWVGSPLVRVPPPPIALPARPAAFDRQMLAIDRPGQSALAQTTLGVVGLGGGGSHLVQQAAHIGFGRLVLLDPDRVEETNLSRLVGASSGDVGRLKTEVMADMVRSINPDVRIDLCAERLPSSNSIELVKKCDLLVSAVDSYTARNEVQRIAWRHLLPLVDIGLGISVVQSNGVRAVRAVAGHVHVYLPGGPCMWCSDLVTEAKLAEERGGQAVPYLPGVASPQVVHFNGLLASQAMVEAMQVATGFLPTRDRTGHLIYRGIPGELVRSLPERRPDCPVCESELGAGDPVW